ncbi:hypothetical protein DPMN_055518 [Dreissena polymorpha]|uniref:Uncharacterized protein n=1 Tax=Dreissena polymorpha TaxID=45954 RepID=A0A9D4CS00_DREPO|nr:hypothetical protein DPMN_055518 [Dreissena polymorpha]
MKEKEALLARKEQMLQRQALKISQQKEELAVCTTLTNLACSMYFLDNSGLQYVLP